MVSAQTPVQVVVKGGSVDSMQPSDLYSGTQYAMTVKVLDENGTPKAGSTVAFSIAGGAVTIDGDSSATTGSDGVAKLAFTFTAGGIVKLWVDDSKAATLTILYPSSPAGAMGVIALLFTVLVVSVGYTAYVGPVKWMRTK
jgi:hypothetical protein